jgi:hypothetical protein
VVAAIASLVCANFSMVIGFYFPRQRLLVPRSREEAFSVPRNP